MFRFRNCSESIPAHIPIDFREWIVNNWNCSNYSESCKELAQADIAGPGVISAFLVTTITTLVLAWVSYLFHADDSDLLAEFNILDRYFLRWLWQYTKRRPALSSVWARTLQKTILMFSDSHIVTGLAILTAGFFLSHDLTVYHYHVVVYLAWQASSTHLTTLTVLRPYLRRNRAVLKWRVAAMTALFIMLFVALVLTASSAWSLSLNSGHTIYYDSLVVCGWQKKYMNHWGKDSIFAICFLTLGYVTRLVKLFVVTTRFFRKWVRDRPSSWLKSLFDESEKLSNLSDAPAYGVLRLFWQLLAIWLLGIYVLLRSLFDLYESVLSELIWLTFSLVYGTLKVSVWKESPISEFESALGFGQILAIVLLLLPIFALPELYAISKHRQYGDNAPLTAPATSPTCQEISSNHGMTEFEQLEYKEITLAKERGSTGGTVAGHDTDEDTCSLTALPDIAQKRKYPQAVGSMNSDYEERGSRPLLPQSTSSHERTSETSDFPSDTNILEKETSSHSTITHAEPAQSSHRPPLLCDPEYVYRFKSFKWLIFLNTIGLSGPGILLIILIAVGAAQPADILLYDLTWFYGFILPCLLGPAFIWFVLMMPFSQITARTDSLTPGRFVVVAVRGLLERRDSSMSHIPR